MKGTWQSTGGSGSTPLLAAAAVAGALLAGSGAVTAAVAALTDLLIAVLACASAVVLAALAAAVLVWRRHHRLPSVPEQIALARSAQLGRAAGPRQLPAAAPAQLHLHFHAAPGEPLPALPEKERQPRC